MGEKEGGERTGMEGRSGMIGLHVILWLVVRYRWLVDCMAKFGWSVSLLYDEITPRETGGDLSAVAVKLRSGMYRRADRSRPIEGTLSPSAQPATRATYSMTPPVQFFRIKLQ